MNQVLGYNQKQFKFCCKVFLTFYKCREEIIQKRKDLKISRKLQSSDKNETKEMDLSKPKNGELSWSGKPLQICNNF